MDAYESDDYVDAALREKQAKCSHPSVRCSLCGLYKDQINRQDTIRIAYLEYLLSELGIDLKEDEFYDKIKLSETSGTTEMTLEDLLRYTRFLEID